MSERPPFRRMIEGYYAQSECEETIEDILGVELLGIGYDHYDDSIEIYVMPEVLDVDVDAAKESAILALGCTRFWINFPDGWQRYLTGKRQKVAFNRWEAFNRSVERRRSEDAELEAWRTRFPGYRYKDGDIAIQEVVSE